MQWVNKLSTLLKTHNLELICYLNFDMHSCWKLYWHPDMAFWSFEFFIHLKNTFVFLGMGGIVFTHLRARTNAFTS